MTKRKLRARIAALEAKIREVEEANPLLSHSEHLAVTRTWLTELNELKAKLAKLESR